MDGRSAVGLANRARILETARAKFAERGYRGCTTRELAEAAGVAEPTLFRHFPSKALLFDEAVVAPLAAFLEAFAEKHSRPAPGSRDMTEATYEFYDELLIELTRDTQQLVAITAALAFDESDTELMAQLRPRLRGLLNGLDARFRHEFEARGFGVDPTIGLRAMFAMVLGLTVHGDWLFPDGQTPPREVLVSELVKLTTRGLRGN